ADALAPDVAVAADDGRARGPVCSPPCAPPYETCAAPGGPPGHDYGVLCCHAANFENGGSSLWCKADDASTLPQLEDPATYCALDVGLVDADNVPDVGPIEQCTNLFGRCQLPAPDGPGWLCCNAFGPLIDGSLADPVIDFQYLCQPPDGGPIPLYFPPALDDDAAPGSEADGGAK
ncbi:MAG TPA: hypothetical protein VKU41_21775, partial [Polyangiaceae bacterium]|nr:hypothetical protein [Polyangiaceae bacterium]